MPKGLKIENRTGQTFYNTAWIAGVDYDAEAFDDEFEEDYEDEAELAKAMMTYKMAISMKLTLTKSRKWKIFRTTTRSMKRLVQQLTK